MGCRKEVAGFGPGEFGVCPAFNCRILHGVHKGLNGGRSCWMVTGTMCGESIQGSYHYKAETCSQCEFFHHVKNEEGEKFIPEETLLALAEKII